MIAIATALMISFPAAAGLPPRASFRPRASRPGGVSIRNRHAIATAADDNKLRESGDDDETLPVVAALALWQRPAGAAGRHALSRSLLRRNYSTAI